MLTEEKLLRLMQSQKASAQMWIDQYEKHQDVAGIRNASLAIGKWMGHFNVLLAMYAGEKEMSADIEQTLFKFGGIWDGMAELSFKKRETWDRT